ncbi:hypothetical protein OsJ_33205 [Oryza sativa Japonica Group]|uniref:Uncharacterized protein n=1 Tax=Oryza sativa subsp. japonica TaxID=39947 RepID=B9G9R1_ORYSJ|nr:hypothetical protein OsJ_33205 [Oryza sativa Japonica Group]
MADSLGDPVTNRYLVVTTLNSWSSKFDNMQTLITMQCPFLSFADVRSQLLLEELSKANRHTDQSTVFLASTFAKLLVGSNPAHATYFGAGNKCGSNENQGCGNNSSRNHRCRGGRGGGGGGNQPSSIAPHPPMNQPEYWPTPQNSSRRQLVLRRLQSVARIEMMCPSLYLSLHTEGQRRMPWRCSCSDGTVLMQEEIVIIISLFDDIFGDLDALYTAEWPKVTWHNLDFLEIPPDEIV